MLAGVALSGCVNVLPWTSDDTAILKDFLIDEMVGFNATVRWADGREGIVRLSGPVMVPDEDRRLFRAYSLGKFFDKGNEECCWYYDYLDADLRQIVENQACGVTFDCANETTWRWSGVRGDAPPYGLWYPDLAARGDLSTMRGRVTFEFPWEAEIREDGALELRIERRDANTHFGGPETYVYQPGRMLPDGPDFTVLTYEETGPLEMADRVTGFLDVPEPRPWQGLMFPDENEDHFELGFTHREIALAADERLSRDEDVCVILYDVVPSQFPNNNSAGLLPLSDDQAGEDEVAEVIVETTNLTHVKRTEFKVMRASANGTTRLVEAPPRIVDADPRFCVRVRESPWPEASLADALALFETMALSCDDGPPAVGLYRSSGLTQGRTYSVGGYAWSIRCTPAYVQPGMGLIPVFFASMEPRASLPLLKVYAAPEDQPWIEA